MVSIVEDILHDRVNRSIASGKGYRWHRLMRAVHDDNRGEARKRRKGEKEKQMQQTKHYHKFNSENRKIPKTIRIDKKTVLIVTAPSSHNPYAGTGINKSWPIATAPTKRRKKWATPKTLNNIKHDIAIILSYIRNFDIFTKACTSL